MYGGPGSTHVGTMMAASGFVSSHEPCSMDSDGLVLPLASIPSNSYTLSARITWVLRDLMENSNIWNLVRIKLFGKVSCNPWLIWGINFKQIMIYVLWQSSRNTANKSKWFLRNWAIIILPERQAFTKSQFLGLWWDISTHQCKTLWPWRSYGLRTKDGKSKRMREWRKTCNVEIVRYTK